MAPTGDITPAVFANLVVDRLAPPLRERGFEPVESAEYRHEFERGSVRVIASYGGFREGLSVALQRDEDERPLELAEVLNVTACPRSDLLTIQQLMTVDAGVLDRLLARCTELLVSYGARFLEGDGRVWKAAEAERDVRTAEYNRRAAVSSAVIERADSAWHDSDYAQVRELLAPVRENLDATHRRRLEFAERRSTQGKA